MDGPYPRADARLSLQRWHASTRSFFEDHPKVVAITAPKIYYCTRPCCSGARNRSDTPLPSEDRAGTGHASDLAVSATLRTYSTIWSQTSETRLREDKLGPKERPDGAKDASIYTGEGHATPAHQRHKSQLHTPCCCPRRLQPLNALTATHHNQHKIQYMPTSTWYAHCLIRICHVKAHVSHVFRPTSTPS